MPEVDFKLASRVTAAIIPNHTRTSNEVQPLGPVTDTTMVRHVTRYVFAHLEQTQLGVTMRFTYPFTASATLQVYAQPFISKGTYSNVHQLSATPRAADFASRYVLDTVVADNPGGFNYKQFRSNVVFRLEYRPGSTLFVVWSQGRQGCVAAGGTGRFGGDLAAGSLAALASWSRSTWSRPARYRARLVSMSSIAERTTRLYCARAASSRASAASTSAFTRPRLRPGQVITGPTA